LVLSPPRERPSASRPGRGGGLSSFGGALGDQLRGQRVPGPGGVLVRPDDGGVRAEGPVLPFGFIAPGLQPAQDLLPGPVQRPAAMPVIDGLPVPVLRGQVPPRAAGPRPEQDPVDHHLVITPPAPLPGISGHYRRQLLPVLITEIVPIQAIIHPP
jgi:hypothetical protein